MRQIGSLGALTAVVVLLSVFPAAPSRANVSLAIDIDHGRVPQLFDDHMMLQRDTNAAVYGEADPGETVSVSVAGQTKTTVTPASGHWRLELDPVPAGGPYDLVIQGNNTITLHDVLFGDIWVLSGQSNMMIKRPWPGEVDDYPNARVFKTTWTSRPGGLPFDFARVLNEDLGVPVGVLQRAMRGSSGLVRTWLGPSVVDSTDPVIQEVVATGDYGQSYEAVIDGVTGFAVKGFIWWQGASDIRRRADPGPFYSHAFPAMIQSWRTAWNRGDLPFLFLQESVGRGLQPEQPLPSPYPAADNDDPFPVARMRQAFIEGLALPETQVITSSDLVGGLHPKDREGYLLRIESAVLGFVYGWDMTFTGPTYQSMTIEDGNKVRIRFRDHTATELHSRGPLQGFSITADRQHYVWANAEIQGEEVVVWSDEVPTPVEVRYGYDEDYTFANLFNYSEIGELGCPTFTTDATPAAWP